MPAQANIPSQTFNYHNGETKVFHDTSKTTQYLPTIPAIQRIITEKKLIQGWKLHPRKSKKVILQQT